ncbi:unnamed protein product, partial [Prorocentrum cordatum]
AYRLGARPGRKGPRGPRGLPAPPPEPTFADGPVRAPALRLRGRRRLPDRHQVRGLGGHASARHRVRRAQLDRVSP